VGPTVNDGTSSLYTALTCIADPTLRHSADEIEISGKFLT
jgi:hypothetical protein